LPGWSSPTASSSWRMVEARLSILPDAGASVRRVYTLVTMNRTHTHLARFPRAESCGTVSILTAAQRPNTTSTRPGQRSGQSDLHRCEHPKLRTKHRTCIGLTQRPNPNLHSLNHDVTRDILNYLNKRPRQQHTSDGDSCSQPRCAAHSARATKTAVEKLGTCSTPSGKREGKQKRDMKIHTKNKAHNSQQSTNTVKHKMPVLHLRALEVEDLDSSICASIGDTTTTAAPPMSSLQADMAGWPDRNSCGPTWSTETSTFPRSALATDL